MIIVIFSAFWLFMKLDSLFLNSLSMYVKEQPGNSFKFLLVFHRKEKNKSIEVWNDMFEFWTISDILLWYRDDIAF